mmetsp:Transcript_10708/g.9643  ORF Transcript_10708/g.9643 Transcript_10708/m.9643 type:complete len:660 (+) Transcript_10708:87-2066(+)
MSNSGSGSGIVLDDFNQDNSSTPLLNENSSDILYSDFHHDINRLLVPLPTSHNNNCTNDDLGDLNSIQQRELTEDELNKLELFNFLSDIPEFKESDLQIYTNKFHSNGYTTKEKLLDNLLRTNINEANKIFSLFDNTYALKCFLDYILKHHYNNVNDFCLRLCMDKYSEDNVNCDHNTIGTISLIFNNYYKSCKLSAYFVMTILLCIIALYLSQKREAETIIINISKNDIPTQNIDVNEVKSFLNIAKHEALDNVVNKLEQGNVGLNSLNFVYDVNNASNDFREDTNVYFHPIRYERKLFTNDTINKQLVDAVKRNDKFLVKNLLEIFNFTIYDIVDENGDNLLLIAYVNTVHVDNDIVNMLRSYPIDYCPMNRFDVNIWLCLSGNLEYLKISFENYPEHFIARNFDRNELIHYATMSGSLDVFKFVYLCTHLYLKNPFNIGLRPIDYVISVGYFSIISKEISVLNLINGVGSLPIHFAACNDNIDITEYIYRKDNKCLYSRNNFGDLPIHIAAKYDNIKQLKYMVHLEPSLLFKYNDKVELPIHLAYNFNHFKIFKFIISCNDSFLYEVDNNGLLFVHKAIIDNKMNVFEYLINIDNLLLMYKFAKNGRFPIHVAAETGNLIMFTLILNINDSLLYQPTDVSLYLSSCMILLFYYENT